MIGPALRLWIDSPPPLGNLYTAVAAKFQAEDPSFPNRPEDPE